ncbi:hypothetical protein Phi4:1_gp088 [Cellulophaga phage phi4:1]|uniref:Uncharacterized protein n=5 Tax=Lightbulbvirus TaxID=1918522 RepID=A0A0S2MWJ8_9CAUD|nr:hypothetical protein Phi4:1_gp088 [Cellulophaga phage phi4:1]YP_008241585.1 hypothetical protein Phi17:2_gp090 [Cellulophaga phage phi17:2]ALO80097.1 hypothetical protein Phi4113_088 [Cellulophaga phage phi4:1_13]ALO80294.1 hypothetical protein Phi4118_088 [Cellulophaga phage phi4:1_18]ALO80493.1 hypothetical protein Phi17218_090 [Cellulophaga phage phi17:2_18]AGO47623.1 hypothetical protein Phi17:2_gp090 [Cellulophaga phage phi17:2]AGO49501.1 hypothetical protein Phi4:1_gp088 [Cellulophag
MSFLALIVLLYFGYNWASTALKIEEGELKDNKKTKFLGFLFMVPYEIFIKIKKYISKW